MLRSLSSAAGHIAAKRFSSIPQTTVQEALGTVVVELGKKSVLLKWPERIWGPMPSIPPSKAAEALGQRYDSTDSIGIIREPFLGHNHQGTTNLTQVLSAIELTHGQDHPQIDAIKPLPLAISWQFLQPTNQWLIDEYRKTPEGTFHLHSSSDFFKYLSAKRVRPVLLQPMSENLQAYKETNGMKAARMGVYQSANAVLMVSPRAFGFNEQAAMDNRFMTSVQGQKEGNLVDTVLKEFVGLYRELTEVAGVQVHLFEHGPEHKTPDAVFPNNWFSTHTEQGKGAGLMVLYPMKCINRRMEVREDIVNYLCNELGYISHFNMTIDQPAKNEFLEGTGALVLDRVNRIAYVAESERADLIMANEWAEKMDYKEVVSFKSTDVNGDPVYHTNVMMAVGTDVAIVCAESVEDERQREHLLSKLRRYHTVVEISRWQMGAFCGNVLELTDGRGLPVLAMSSQAFNAFNDDQKSKILRNVAQIHHAPIDTLERVGGGGVRCTLAELF